MKRKEVIMNKSQECGCLCRVRARYDRNTERKGVLLGYDGVLLLPWVVVTQGFSSRYLKLHIYMLYVLSWKLVIFFKKLCEENGKVTR